MVLKAVAETRDGAGNALSKRTKSPRRAHPVGEFGTAYDDAAKGRAIATSGLADVRVKFQGAAPDLPHILAGGRKGYRLTRGLFRVAAYREPKERDWAQPRQFGETLMSAPAIIGRGARIPAPR
jgi:hypothetical protein